MYCPPLNSFAMDRNNPHTQREALEIFTRMDVVVLDCRIREQITTLHAFPASRTLASLKGDILRNIRDKRCPRPFNDLTEERIEFRTAQSGPPVDEGLTLKDVFGKNTTSTKLYVKDLGPQMPYRTHLLAQYCVALAIYFAFYARIPPFFHLREMLRVRTVNCQAAALAWTLHFGRKIYETNKTVIFSKPTVSARVSAAQVAATMLATTFIAYENNASDFLGPRISWMTFFLVLFFIAEVGSHRIHSYLLSLREQSPRGFMMPMATLDPFTRLYNYVSCPKYTYEVASIFFYFMMTHNFYVFLAFIFLSYRFTRAARLEHTALREAFYDHGYPKHRGAIFPFIV